MNVLKLIDGFIMRDAPEVQYKVLKSINRLICIAAVKGRIHGACVFCSACAQHAALPLVHCYIRLPRFVAS